MPLLGFLLTLLQIVPVPIPLPPLDVGGEIVGPYIFREDAGQTTKVILQNGLTAIVREENAVPLVSITTLVKAGYFDEPDSLSGISHVIEHMFFKGTRNRDVGEVARETRGLGGTLNAYTAYDRTVYHVVVPARNAVAAMEIQADALWNPLFDAQELEREVEVVLAENSRKLDNPVAVAEERLYSTAFSRHRMRRWRLGTPDGLRALTRADLTGYYQQYYQPSNIILSVVGQFPREAMLAEIVRLYGGIDDSPVQRDTGPDEPPQLEPRYEWQRADIGQSHAAIGFHVPGLESPDAYVLDVLSAVLTSGRSSRFNSILRDEEGVLVSAVSAYQGFPGMGFFRIQLEGPTPLDAERAALEQLERIRRFGISAEELARAKVMLAGGYYRRLETVDGLAEQLAINEAQGDWNRLASYLPRIQAVTVEDIQNAVEDYFDPGGVSIFEYVTRSAEISTTDARLREGVIRSVPENMVPRAIEELPVPATVPIPGDAVLVTDMVGAPQTLAILRGPDVHVISDRRLPLVSFGIFYPGGRLFETEENAGITELMLQSALRGTRTFGPAAISRRLENAGAQIEVVNEPDFFGYVLEGVSGSLRDALDVLMQIVQEPTFPPELVEQELGLQRQRLHQLRDDNLRFPLQVFMEALFPGHPYSRPGLGLEFSLSDLDADQVAAWHRQQMRGVAPVIVVVGDTTGSSLVFSITEALTNEDLVKRDLPQVDLSELPERTALIEVPTHQSALVLGWRGPTLSSPDRIPMTVLEHVLSGLGGRLFDSIRDREGLAYTVRTFDDFRASSGAFFTYAAFAPENEQRVRDLLDSSLRDLVETGVSEDELERARNSAIGAYEAALQSRRARTLALARAIISGAGVDAVMDFSADVGDLEQDTLETTARRYLDPNSETVAIIRGEGNE